MRKSLVSLFLVVLFSTILLLPGFCSSKEDYFPTDDWRTSTPEEQGIDSAVLAEMFQDIQREDMDIHSVLIIRHGYLVAECYRYPYNRNTGHNIKSVSKSILSTLTGIALRENYLKSIDQKLLDFFPEYINPKMDPRKKEITLRHLLTMTAGLGMDDQGMMASHDWVEYALNLPVLDNPGTKFRYNTALTHLMSAILAKTSGMSTLELGRKYLFDPLGISIKQWNRDPQGYYFGGSDMYFTPGDMAKYGYLYLHHGIWNGRQVVPRKWVANSLKPQTLGKTTVDYGYWWWLKPEGASGYDAEGWGGQYIIVNPKLDMVIVFTSADFFKARLILSTYLYPAVKSSVALKPNPPAVQELQTVLTELAHPKTNPIAPLPEIAAQINGKTYDCSKNEWGLTSFIFSFPETGCSFKMTQGEVVTEVPVGLDGVYRVTLRKNGTEFALASKGQWLDEHQFLMEWLEYEEPIRCRARFDFRGDSVEVTLTVHPIEGTFIFSGKEAL